MNKFTLVAAFAAAAAASVPAYSKAGDFIVRGRVILVAPNDSSGSVHPTFPGEDVKVDNAWAPEIDGTYMATDHIGFELIAATTKHHVSGKNGTLGSIGQLASTWVLPPTLTAQYHFAPEGKVRPYLGAGLNYTQRECERPPGSGGRKDERQAIEQLRTSGSGRRGRRDRQEGIPEFRRQMDRHSHECDVAHGGYRHSEGERAHQSVRPRHWDRHDLLTLVLLGGS